MRPNARKSIALKKKIEKGEPRQTYLEIKTSLLIPFESKV